MRLTNRLLSAITGYPYSRIRRWARDVLPPDHNAALQSGYARQLTKEDGLKIFLYGHMVSDQKIPTYRAKEIVDKLVKSRKEEFEITLDGNEFANRLIRLKELKQRFSENFKKHTIIPKKEDRK